MGGVDLLAEARAAGLKVRAEAGQLIVRGPRSAELLVRRILACKAELLAVLIPEATEASDFTEFHTLKKDDKLSQILAPTSSSADQLIANDVSRYTVCGNRAVGPSKISQNFPPKKREQEGLVADCGSTCERCGATTWRDVPIHGGRSIRRDCGRCGRFIDFPIWYGTTCNGEQ